MDPIADGNPIGWTIRTLEKKLPKMLERAGYPQIAAATDLAEVERLLPKVEACARELFAAKRNTVKHNRGTHIFEAGNIRFGLEMRRQAGGDGGLAVHVLADIGGSTGKSYVEETEILAFDCFWQAPHYHYGPRNKNHRIFWDKTLVEDPLGWVFEQFENRKLGAMIERAGYPGIAADLDLEKIGSLLPDGEEEGPRDAGGRRAVDRSPRAAVGADPEPGPPVKAGEGRAIAAAAGRWAQRFPAAAAEAA